MKIFVSGATGVLGKRSVRLLVQKGHEVSGVVREERKAQMLEALWAKPVRIDPFDCQQLAETMRGHDVILNLATSIPRGNKAAWKSSWNANHRIRRELSALLVQAARDAGVRRFVQESITLLYADGGGQWIDESHPLAPTWITASALDAERNALDFAEGGRQAVVLRFAGFYGPDSHHSVDAIAAARKGQALSLGSRSAYLSAITTDDAAAAVVAALEADSGVYNVADDVPLSRSEHFLALGHAVGRDKLRFPPAFFGRLMGGKMDMLLRSHRISNRRFKDATGWEPSVASARDGWQGVVRSSAGSAGVDRPGVAELLSS